MLGPLPIIVMVLMVVLPFLTYDKLSKHTNLPRNKKAGFAGVASLAPLSIMGFVWLCLEKGFHWKFVIVLLAALPIYYLIQPWYSDEWDYGNKTEDEDKSKKDM